MAHKQIKLTRSKGERLGWMPIDKVNYVSVSSLVIRGKRIYTKEASSLVCDPGRTRKLIIP